MGVLVTTHLLLWGVVLALAAVVVSLMRQTGVLLERISPAGLSADASLAIKTGQAVERMALTTLRGAPHAVGGALGTKAQLLFFASPRCDVCKSIVPELNAFSQAAPHMAVTIAVADASEGVMPEEAAAIAQVPADKIANQFGVSQLPHLVLIREDGVLERSQYLSSAADFKAAVLPLIPAASSGQDVKHNDPIGGLV